MSEQEKSTSFMQELDQWSETNIFGPLYFAARSQKDNADEEWEQVVF